MGRTWSMLAVLIALASSPPGRAELMFWQGTLEFREAAPPGKTPDVASYSGAGVATVNGSSSGLVLRSFALDDPPEATGLSFPLMPSLNGWINGPIVSSAAFSGLATTTGPVVGHMKMLGQITRTPGTPLGWNEWLPPQTLGNHAVGLGQGGVYEFNVTAYPPEWVRVSVMGAPWTRGSATVRWGTVTGGATVPDQTVNGALAPVTRTLTGFVHGPLSQTSTAAQPGGAIQLVTPLQITESLLSINDIQWHRRFGLFGVLTVEFLPEPGLGISLIAAATLLALLGRRRNQLAKVRLLRRLARLGSAS